MRHINVYEELQQSIHMMTIKFMSLNITYLAPTLHIICTSVSTSLRLNFPPSSSMCDLSLFSVPRNYDPALHPFEVSREYTRALNATKLERVFAKPFLASLDGHRDGVNCMAKHTTSLSTLLSGSCDGEVTIS